MPLAGTIGFLTHPRLPGSNVEAAARSIGLELVTVQAATEAAIDAAFASLAARRVGAVIIGSDRIFWQWRKRIVSLTTGALIPDIYESKVFVQDGGLMSYGADVVDAYREAGVYVAKILKGSKPLICPSCGSPNSSSAQPQAGKGARPRHSGQGASDRRRSD